jgi:hypothetical protein
MCWNFAFSDTGWFYLPHQAVKYYKKCVHDIQYNLKDNEWNDFKDIQTAYKLTALPSNPGIEHDSDSESNGW